MYYSRQHRTLIEASVELGHTFNTDAYGGENAGVYYSLSSQNTVPVRETSEFAYRELISVLKNPSANVALSDAVGDPQATHSPYLRHRLKD